jgi:hypothetical protein
MNPPEAQDSSSHSTRDFFISYTNSDRPWAEWAAWQLEEGGYTTILQAWDFEAGSHFVTEMHKATQVAERTIVILSMSMLILLWRGGVAGGVEGRPKRR